MFKLTLSNDDFIKLWRDIDYQSTRFPKLENDQFKDPNKGLWELFNQDIDIEKIHARDPKKDVKDLNVTIDFGTSSTVIAYREENGEDKLIRIGLDEKEFWSSEVNSKHFENPTVLDFVDFKAMMEDWQSEAYRPLINWDDVHCSHVALETLNHGDENIGRVLTRIKQWALRSSKEKVRVTDTKKYEYTLEPLTERNPVKGALITISEKDSFDPVELYAWFIGMNLNWRNRGLFLRYFMTFPVGYSQAVKQKILSSFRRGLQRSLPDTLVNQSGVLEKFQVEECASEPAAYAISALDVLGLYPTKKGIAYAVFDFGGGTADFDYGYYKLPSESEKEQGWEAILEHFSSGGDAFLGGENLLANMAFQIFQKNLDVLKGKAKFSKPLDILTLQPFAGCEMFIDDSQNALINSQIMITRLRQFWENGIDVSNGQSLLSNVKLKTISGADEIFSLKISNDELCAYLENRIGKGIENFCTTLTQAFQHELPEEIHILLGGNSSRSPIVQAFFTKEIENKSSSNVLHKFLEGYDIENGDKVNQERQNFIFEGGKKKDQLFKRMEAWLPKDVKISVHKPLPIVEEDPYKATAKTGVALGLLALCPGGEIKVVNKSGNSAKGTEAPFAFNVGRISLKKFEPILLRGTEYQKWFEIGPVRDNVFNLAYSQSVREMRQGDTDLKLKRIDFYGNKTGCKVFSKAISPCEIKVCASKSEAEIKQDEIQLIKLK